jgi:Peptidase family M23
VDDFGEEKCSATCMKIFNLNFPLKHFLPSFFLLLFFSSELHSQSFQWPLKIPIHLAAGFGDIRADHYHTGIDIRTNGKTGLPVYAAAGGYVSRIRVSPYGYGNAIYITHPNGMMTVYGHLSRFNAALQSYILKQQHLKQQNEIDLALNAHEFPVHAGELIAYSGNTGDSGGPHLHFEIRDSHGETFPLNPALHGLKVKDQVPPVVTKVYFFPIDEDGHQHEPIVQPIKLKDTTRYDTVHLPFQHFGVAFEGSDYVNGSSNDLEFYESNLWFDSLRRFTIRFDRLDFLKARCVNAHIVYPVFQNNGTVIHRMWKLQGDVHSIYHNVLQNGMIKISDTGLHFLQLVVSDANKNRDTIRFFVQSKSSSPYDTLRFHPSGNWFHYDSVNQVLSDSFELHLQRGALFEDMDFHFAKITSTDSFSISPAFRVGDSSVPLFKSLNISILPDKNIPDSLKDKVVMIRSNNGHRSAALAASWDANFATASFSQFGIFYLTFDTIKPRIKTLNVSDSATFSNNTIIFDVNDNLSGIATYNARLDGKWTPIQYDPKVNQIYCNLPLLKNGYHQLEITVSDAVKNTATLNITFNKIEHARGRTKSSVIHHKGSGRK